MLYFNHRRLNKRISINKSKTQEYKRVQKYNERKLWFPEILEIKPANIEAIIKPMTSHSRNDSEFIVINTYAKFEP